MNIDELPAFLSRYNKARAKKSGHFIYFTVEVDEAYLAPFFLSYTTEQNSYNIEHVAPTFAALIKKMNKDIDGLT